MVMPIRLCFHLLLLATAAMLAAPVSAELSVSLDRNPVRPNETFTLDIKTDEVDADEPTLDLPAGIQQLRRNTISSRSIVNGKISAERTWRYNLVARQPGEYLIPAIRVGADESAPLALTVLAPDTKSAAAIENQPVVLRATVDQRDVYSQQQILLTVQMLRKVPMRFAQLNEPSLATALVQKLGEDSEYETTINGSSYLVIERRYAIFPQQAGELVIPSLRFQADISNERQLSMFGVFEETQPISLETQAITINVKAPALPAPWLPTPQLTLTDAIAVGPYRVGEPLTWTISVTVDGLLPAQLPSLTPEASPHWRVYPDQPQDQTQITSTGLHTTRSQKFALVPLHDGDQALPSLSLPWWRLSDNSAQIATLPSQTIRVEAAAAAPVSKPVIAIPAAPTEPKAAPATLAETVAPATVVAMSSGLWPWLTGLFASLWLFTLLLWWWRQQRTPKRRPTANAASPSSTADHSLRALLDACKRHDAPAARRHLLQLTGASNLSSLAAQHQGDMAAVISELNQALYGPPPQYWRGDRLAATAAELLRTSPRSTSRSQPADLPPLYPAH